MQQNETDDRYVLGKVIAGYQLKESVEAYHLVYDEYVNLETGEEYSFYQERTTIEFGINTEYIGIEGIDTMYGWPNSINMILVMVWLGNMMDIFSE